MARNHNHNWGEWSKRSTVICSFFLACLISLDSAVYILRMGTADKEIQIGVTHVVNRDDSPLRLSLNESSSALSPALSNNQQLRVDKNLNEKFSKETAASSSTTVEEALPPLSPKKVENVDSSNASPLLLVSSSQKVRKNKVKSRPTTNDNALPSSSFKGTITKVNTTTATLANSSSLSPSTNNAQKRTTSQSQHLTVPTTHNPSSPPQEVQELPLVVADNATISIPVRLTNSSMFIFVLSRRDSFRIRQVIRETWAANHDNIYFVLGAACKIPWHLRADWKSCENKAISSTNKNETNNVTTEYNEDPDFEKTILEEEVKIQQELENNRDILLAENFVDSYQSLPAKIKFAYRWATTNLPKATYFLKVDDDMYLRVPQLLYTMPWRRKVRWSKFWDTKMVKDQNAPKDIFDPLQHAMIAGGHVMRRQKVQRQGKWAEFDEYKNDTYPPLVGGDGGHMITRAFAEYIANNSERLFNYQGEDVSLGIWASEAPMQVYIVTDKRMSSSGASAGNYCQRQPRSAVIGHKFGEERMRRCYERDQLVLLNAATPTAAATLKNATASSIDALAIPSSNGTNPSHALSATLNVTASSY